MSEKAHIIRASLMQRTVTDTDGSLSAALGEIGELQRGLVVAGDDVMKLSATIINKCKSCGYLP